MSPGVWGYAEILAGFVVGFGAMLAGRAFLVRWQRRAARRAVLAAIGGAGDRGLDGDRTRIEAWRALTLLQRVGVGGPYEAGRTREERQ